MYKNISANKLIYIGLLLSLVLIVSRILYSGYSYGTFLIWNLFLAWIPYAISQLLVKYQDLRTFWQYFLLGAWLLFFPNAPYIITDLFHLKQRPSVPYWYDLLVLFWAAWNGLILGIKSLMNIEKFLIRHFKPRWVNISINLFLVLCAFGVYAGRYLRWNSWDIVTKPGDIVSDMLHIATNPTDNARTWGVTLLFSVVMILIYRTLKSLNTPPPQ